MDKSIFASKTFWTAILAPVIGHFGSKYFNATPDTVNVITDTLATMAPAIIGLRFMTNGPVSITGK